MNRLTVLLLAIACVAVAAADVEESDGLEEVHDADTPTRQAQRAMLAEREAATAAHASEDVLGMRLQAVSTSAEAGAEAERPQPHARRISGASKSFSPNDKMCVMCQFLTQRIQQDLSLGFGGHPFYAGAGTPPYAMIAAVSPVKAGGDSFMEVAAADSDEESDEDLVEIDVEGEDELEVDADAEEEADSEDESEEEESDEAEEMNLIQVEDEEEEEAEAEEESEEEDAEEEESEDESEEEVDADSEDASFLEVSSDDEGEWAAPEYTNAAEEVAPATNMLETAADDFQTPAYVDAVYQTAEADAAEESTESEETESDEALEGTADSAEPAFFESSAVAASAAQDEGEWTTPEYTGPAATEPVAAAESVDAELTNFVQTSEEEEWSTPTYTDAAAASTGAKSYARVIVPAAAEQSLIEAAATETVVSTATSTSESGAELFAPRIVRSRKASRARPTIFHTQKRYRSSDAIVPRPRWNRYEAHSPRHLRVRLLAGMALRNAEHSAYDALESYCSTRLPESYGKYCRPVLRQFRRITEGLSYGDNVNRVCLAVNLCKPTSYMAQSPHDRLAARN